MFVIPFSFLIIDFSDGYGVYSDMEGSLSREIRGVGGRRGWLWWLTSCVSVEGITVACVSASICLFGGYNKVFVGDRQSKEVPLR